MPLPSVSFRLNTAGIATVAPGTGDVPLILATASAGPYGVAQGYGSLPAIIAAYTSGPLVDAASLALAAGAKEVVLYRMFSGTLGSVTNTGSGTGTVAFTGSPTEPFGAGLNGAGIIVQVTASSAGGSNFGTFNYSLDGGNTYSASMPISSGLVFAIPGTGVTATFTGAATVGVWDSGDTHVAPITASPGEMYAYGGSFAVLQVGPSGATATAAGTGTFTNNAGNPIDSYAVQIQIVTAGTLASGLAQYIVSFDGGLTFSPPQTIATSTVNLGNGVNLTAAETGGAGATPGFAVGDVYSFSTLAPQYTVTDITNVLDNLASTNLGADFIHVALQPNTIAAMATLAGQLDILMTSYFAENLFQCVIMDAPIDTARASIDAALIAERALMSLTSNRVFIGAGQNNTASLASGYQVARGTGWALAAQFCATSIGQDVAEVDLGPVVGITNILRNEAQTPGLDAAQFTTMRTIEGENGYYLTNGNVVGPSNSDIKWAQHIRVLNECCKLALPVLNSLLSKGVRVVVGAGTMDPRDAANIQTSVASAIATGTTQKGACTAIQVALDLTADLLTNGGVQPVTIGEVPLGYLKFITVTIGLTNAQLQALAA